MAKYTPDTYVYFIYSAMQLKDRTSIEASIRKTFKPGYVVVKGKRYQYTELSTTGKSKYSDARIMAEGKIGNITYSDITSV